MSTFIYLLITIGIVAAKYYLEQKSKASAPTTPSDVLTEIFPMLSEQEDEETEAEEAETPVIIPDLNPATISQAPKVTVAQSTSTTTVEENKIVTKPNNKEKNDGTSDKLNLSKRGEARRAFIYSEIFNRKYE